MTDIVLIFSIANFTRLFSQALSIWFPISTYVICDFEHCLATMFFLVTAKLNGADFDLIDFLKTILPGTLGNLVGGAIAVGIGLSHIPIERK